MYTPRLLLSFYCSFRSMFDSRLRTHRRTYDQRFACCCCTRSSWWLHLLHFLFHHGTTLVVEHCCDHSCTNAVHGNECNSVSCSFNLFWLLPFKLYFYITNDSDDISELHRWTFSSSLFSSFFLTNTASFFGMAQLNHC